MIPPQQPWRGMRCNRRLARLDERLRAELGPNHHGATATPANPGRSARYAAFPICRP